MSDQFEFDESELYGDSGPQPDVEPETDEPGERREENELELSDGEAEPEGSLPDSLDDPVDRPGSAASSSTQLEIPSENKQRLGTSFAVATLHSRPPRRTTSVPESHVKLGASAPINIPYMGTWRTEFNSDARTAIPQTFVPPHELSRREDFTFSFTGASPSANLKREKLRVRNRILEQTGFLETEKSEQPDGAPQQLATLGGLSAAFGGRQFNGP